MRFDYQTTVAIGQQTIGETVVVVVEQSIQTKKQLMMNNNKPNQTKTKPLLQNQSNPRRRR
jgi:hypothetical protein